jgi:1-phosphofructokinase family hexose kinase
MILTVTANPTIDRVLFVRDFAMQDVVRAAREVVSPSGKGIDVSIILHVLGAPTVAVALNAGLTGDMLAALLAAQGVPCDFVPAGGHTRVAALIMDQATGRQSTILAATLTAGPEHLDALAARVAAHAPQSWGLVCAGSLPPGLPVTAFAELLALGRAHGLVTLLDSSGAGLRHGLAGRPGILKVNARELAEVAAVQGHELPALPEQPHRASLAPFAAFLRGQIGAWAGEAVVVTLGKAGALAVTAEGAHYAPALQVPLVSPAGAGDAVSAGLMLARRRGQTWADALRLGVAAAGAVVMNEGTAVCTADQVAALLPQVEVHALEI